ncbi:UDP-N-acetylmuramate dehydrogenase [Shewanella youngdeokensis]|uniref:UDP-N-acetylenolpyruvoylglucosamine reductase n=1 Tax=Shewanella youngdeokensis TaxID=2999068 RepID=A0ABZ0JY01_9GAMM|nr:UDP-N-acetylmuramate dehydrogenase [Shewanella sp. DAU334]
MNHLVSLKSYNTFGLEHGCQELVIADTTQELVSRCVRLYREQQPMLVLGGGSNVILCEDFLGTVVLVKTQGIEVSEDDSNFFLTVAAGENWHNLICYCLDKGIAGMENLALIPGTVGAAPIQNIGAYGAEFNDFCQWVEYVDLSSGLLYRLNADECQFGYRESIFKQQLSGKVLITNVGFKVSKVWQPNLNYGPLKALYGTGVTPRQVFDCICETRMAKLPDPQVFGNAGSFFKNPVIANEQFNSLVQRYPNIVGYPQGLAQTKVAAGWLIEAAGLKGYQIGDAAVHERQALVLINQGDATSDELLALSGYIIDRIHSLFGIKLEPEPRMISTKRGAF